MIAVRETGIRPTRLAPPVSMLGLGEERTVGTIADIQNSSSHKLNSVARSGLGIDNKDTNDTEPNSCHRPKPFDFMDASCSMTAGKRIGLSGFMG